MGQQVVKIKNITSAWERERCRVLDFTCGDAGVALYQYLDGTWDVPISDGEACFTLDDIRDFHRCLGALIQFLEKDEAIWSRKCGGE